MFLSNTDSHVSALRISTESLERMVAKEVAFLCPIAFFFLYFVLTMVVLISVYSGHAPFFIYSSTRFSVAFV